MRTAISRPAGRGLALLCTTPPGVVACQICIQRGELAPEIAAYLAANREKLDFKQALRLRAYLRGAAGAEARGGLRLR